MLTNLVLVRGGGDFSVGLVRPLRITALDRTAQGPRIQFHTFSGRHYTLEHSSRLVPLDWVPLPSGSSIPGNGHDMSLTDPDWAASRQRYYRLKEVVP